MKKPKIPYYMGLFTLFMHLLFHGGVSMILSKKFNLYFPTYKEAMNYLLGMKKKQTIKLNIGLERILSFLLCYNAPAQYSKQKDLNDR